MERPKGLSVQINNREEFEAMKQFLGEDVLYVDFVPQMEKIPTGIIIHHQNTHLFTPGSVGEVKYQKEFDTRVVLFKDHFIV